MIDEPLYPCDPPAPADPAWTSWEPTMSEAGNLAAALSVLLRSWYELNDPYERPDMDDDFAFAQARLDAYLDRQRYRQAERRWSH